MHSTRDFPNQHYVLGGRLPTWRCSSNSAPVLGSSSQAGFGVGLIDLGSIERNDVALLVRHGCRLHIDHGFLAFGKAI